jgi:hypothetical protein
MHDNEPGNTVKLIVLVEYEIAVRLDLALTRRLKIFIRFAIKSTLSGIVRVLSINEENSSSYKKYMAPGMDDEIQCSRYCFSRRTVTNDRVQEPYASPYLEGLVQSEREYQNVKNRHASPCDSIACVTKLLQPVGSRNSETYVDR